MFRLFLYFFFYFCFRKQVWTLLFQFILKNHFCLSYEWETVIFCCHIHTFHENAEGVLFKIGLKTLTQTLLDGVLFINALRNKYLGRILKKIQNIFFFIWAVFGILSVKSVVNGLKEKVCFVATLNLKEKERKKRFIIVWTLYIVD